MKRCQVAVIGTGSWGTVFAKLLDLNDQKVSIWGSDLAVIADIQETSRNQKYQPDVIFSNSVIATTEVSLALENAELVVLAVPAQRLRSNLINWSALVPKNAIVLSLIKGLEQETDLRVSQLIAEYLPNEFAVLSGPNLAAEIAAGQIAAATVASVNPEVAKRVQQMCSSATFKVFRSSDVVGVEIAGTTKNIIALATGIVIGLGLGENAQAAILTRGLAEMVAIGAAVGGKRETFLGLAGIGDLIATSQSPYSRNRSFGVLLGRGIELEVAREQIGQTVEAMKSTQPILHLAERHALDVPIIRRVSEILNGSQKASTILDVFNTDSHELEH